MAEEVWANPLDVLAHLDRMRTTTAPAPVPKPDLGSVLASAPLITLANVLDDLPATLAREMGRFADVATVAMFDVVDADGIVAPGTGPRRGRDDGFVGPPNPFVGLLVDGDADTGDDGLLDDVADVAEEDRYDEVADDFPESLAEPGEDDDD